MNRIKRMVHIDFHTMPGIDNFGAGFSAKEMAKQFSDANVEYINMCARCNIGFSYYPTKIGMVYPGLKGDLLADVIEECHKVGIGVSAYLNGGINHQLMIEHPEFMTINKDGTVYRDDDRVADNYFRTPCLNSGYRKYLIEEIKEILTKDPDGIFCDCMKPKKCYCPSCIKKMHQKNIDIEDDDQVISFALDTLRETFAQIRQVVPKDKRLLFNGHPHEDLYWSESHIEVECLVTDPIWGYDFAPAVNPYYRKFNDDLVYMFGRFISTWGDVAGVKSEAAIENDVYDALLYGYTPCVGDHLHPGYGLDEELYEKVGKIYGYVKSLEPWTDNTKPIVEAAILRNKVNHKNFKDHVTPSDKGCARLLSELKISYDVVNEDMDFGGYKLLILPDNIEITDKLNQKLEAFSGSILSSGKSIKKTKVWDYISEFCEDTNSDGFYRHSKNVRANYCNGIKMKSPFGVMEYIEPYFNRHYDGLHAYAYIPPRGGQGFCALAVKENRAHICFNIFKAYFEYGTDFHKKLLKEVIDRLLPKRIIDADALPITSRVTLMRGKEGDVLHIKATYPEYHGKIGVVKEHCSIDAGTEIVVDGEYSGVVSLPEKLEIDCETKDGKTKIKLPKIKGYKPLLLIK